MAKTKDTKRSNSKVKSKGKTTVQKGTQFENTVADIYQLLGANVIQNIEICQKKVDIFATFPLPASPIGHRIIVECKDEKKVVAQNQRIMQFKGLLETARKSGEADSAEIITRVPWSDQAKGFALNSGIALLTYAEKIAQLINFDSYLKWLVNSFEKGTDHQYDPPLGAYYVDLSAEYNTRKGVKRLDVIDRYIYQWMRRENKQQHLAILGEYGTGKTSLCQRLAHDLAALYLKEKGLHRIPILFNLREFTKTLKIESLVTSFLDEKCGVINPRYKLFQAMNDAGIFVLIFDGFDEMASRVDTDTLEINLREIEKLATSKKIKVIITSRIEFFISEKEEQKFLRPKGELLATRAIEYEPLKILPWNDEQVNSFLKKRVPLIKGEKKGWAYYRDRIRDIQGLSDLSKRPVLLDMIVKTLPQLIESQKPINRPNLYDTYLLGEIKRQKILKKRTLLLKESVRFSVLQQLAVDFYASKISAFAFSDALKHIRKFVKPPREELEVYTRDFLTCSFLARTGNEYSFSHRTIMEYLISKALLNEIKEDNPRVIKADILDPVIIGFLTELNPDKDILWNWIESTKDMDIEESKFLGGNAATLLCRLNRAEFAGKDLSKTNLTGADLSLADLRNVNFRETLIKYANLANAKFFKKDLLKARIYQVIISLFCIWKLKKQNRKKHIKPVFGILEKEVGERLRKLFRTQILGTGIYFGDYEYNLVRFTITCLGRECLESLHNIKASQLNLQAYSFYYDEIEKMHEEISEQLTFTVHEILNEERTHIPVAHARFMQDRLLKNKL